MRRTFTLFLALFVWCATASFADSGNPATLTFDLNACTSFTNNGTNTDYSEFTGVASNTNEIELSVVNDNLYRINPSVNRHSCTPGVNNTEAMCISYDPDCTYAPGSTRAARIDISLNPTGSEPVRLSNLSFYEMAPVMFDWIDGPSGSNNYPTRYGLRVLRDGQVIFDQSDIETTTDWTLESFDFSGADFQATQATTFNIEILAYCPVGVFAMQSVWDLDEIQFTAECVGNQACTVPNTTIDGGTVALANGSTIYTGCAGNIVIDVTNTTTATNYAYIITDENDNILAFADASATSTLDLSGAPPGECHVWGWSHAANAADPIPGTNINTLNDEACEEISSNFIRVFREDVRGGTLTGGPFEFCVGDGVADNLAPGAITLSGNAGTNSQWIVTDEVGNILGLPPMPSAVDFDGAGPGVCQVWHLSFEGTVNGLAMGSNTNDLDGCFNLSNPVAVIRNQPEGGTLTGGPYNFVVDGVPDMVSGVTLTGNTGAETAWIVTDDQGNILGLPPMPSVVDFDAAGVGVCYIYSVSYDGSLTGLSAGNNVSNLGGCFDLSNFIVVNRTDGSACPANGGTLSGGPFIFNSVGDGVADNIPAGSITLSGNVGTNAQWVVTDSQGYILGLPPMPSVVNFDNPGAGTCLIWNLSFEGALTGAEVNEC